MTVIGDSAIVDDQDASVQYTGSWGKAGVAEEFRSTTSFPQVTGASLSLSFVGTSIQTYVTYTGGPTVFMSIDDGTFTATFERPQSANAPDINPGDPIHNQPLWTDSPILSDGPHTLFINSTSDPIAGTIFIDYFIYTISAHTPLQDKSLFVDDRDSRIRYGDGWGQFGTDPDFMHTTLGSSKSGNNFVYAFQGIGISMYGGFLNASADQMVQASMVIDDRSPIIFAPGPQTQAVAHNYQYFSVDDLEQGNHTMTVTALNDHTVWVDYLLVIPGNVSLLTSEGSTFSSAISTPSAGTSSERFTSSSSTSAPSSGASSDGSTSSSALSAASASTSSTTPPVNKHSSSSKASLGIIIGGTVGGIVGLAIILSILLLWMRQRRRPLISPRRSRGTHDVTPYPFTGLSIMPPRKNDMASVSQGYRSADAPLSLTLSMPSSSSWTQHGNVDGSRNPSDDTATGVRFSRPPPTYSDTL